MAVVNNKYGQYQIMGNTQINRNVTGSSQSSVSSIANKPHQQYQQSMINTATPQELTLMLYNGLVRFIKLSMEAMDEKDIEKTNNYIVRAQDIVIEFMSTLDMGYEVSNGLMALYDYMNRRLTDANVSKDKAIAAEVLGFAEQLRDTWAQAMKIAKQQVVNK